MCVGVFVLLKRILTAVVSLSSMRLTQIHALNYKQLLTFVSLCSVVYVKSFYVVIYLF